MKTSSLESKTIRPGLSAYSFYRSDRHLRRDAPQVVPVIKTNASHLKRNILVIMMLALLGFGGYSVLNMSHDAPQASNTPDSGSSKKAAAIATVPTDKTQTATPVNKCAGNDIPQFVIISITDRHLWVCEANKQVRDSPVITGMQKVIDNATPPGTYKIYAKQQDTVLTGNGSTGSWRQPVSYWMPFLDNQYGTYGFHDASWRDVKEFGNIDPYSNDGSHGCIQMSVANTAWLYNWAHVGATVSIYL